MMRAPAKLTLERSWSLVRRADSTLLRLLEYDAVREVELDGLTLDIGGGRQSSAYPWRSIRGSIHTMNVDRRMKPTVIADVARGLPAAAETYGNVLCLNTLEHVWDDRLVLREIHRVLRPRGTL